MTDKEALLGDEFAVRPVSTLELRENEHALVADLERTGSWYLLVVRGAFILIWNKVVVEVEWKI